MLKKLLAVLTSSMFLTTLFVSPSGASPFDTNCDLSGSGTSESPYLLGSESDLLEMQSCVVGGTTHFDLIANIKIGDRSQEFRGFYFSHTSENVVMDGKGFKISGLRLSTPEMFSFDESTVFDMGFFGRVADLTIRDLTIESPQLYGSNNATRMALVVARVQDLDVQRVTLISDGMDCHFGTCGPIAGRVDGSTTLSDITVFVKAITGGDKVGGMIGETRGTFSVDRARVQTQMVTNGAEYLGGLIGRVYEPNVAVSEAYVSTLLVARYSESDFPAVGGFLGSFIESQKASTISIENSFANMRTERAFADAFGGIIGKVEVYDPATLELNLSNSRLRLYASPVDPNIPNEAQLGGILGTSSDSDSTSINLNANNLIVQPAFRTHQDNAALLDAHSLVDPDDFTSMAFENVYVDSEYSTSSEDMFSTSFTTQTTETGVVYRTTSQIEAMEGITLPDDTDNPGVLGQDKWELCESEGPFPVVTPNPCDSGEIRLTATSIEAQVNEQMETIKDMADSTSPDNVFLYEVQPELPGGIFLDSIGGVISGSPTEVTPLTTYKLTKYTAKTESLFSFPGVAPFDVSDGRAWAYSQPVSATFTLETKLPPTPQAPEPEVIRDTVVIEREVPAEYAGPLITSINKQLLAACTEETVVLKGQDFDKLTKASLGGKELVYRAITPTTLELDVPCLDSGKHDVVFESNTGDITYEDLFEVLAVTTTEIDQVTGLSSDQVVNAGSFKGYVAVYAKGYEGKKLSAKIGNDWVIVDSLASDFERITDFTGAGYDINVRIFIDGVLQKTVALTTK